MLTTIPYNLDITIRTNIPLNARINYTPNMTVRGSRGKYVYIDPFTKFTPEVMSKIPADLRRKEMFNKDYFMLLARAHVMKERETQPVKPQDYSKKNYKEVVNSNIETVLQTLFPPKKGILYVGGEPYTIFDYHWEKGDWQVGVKNKDGYGYKVRLTPTQWATQVMTVKSLSAQAKQAQANKKTAETTPSIKEEKKVRFKDEENKTPLKSALKKVKVEPVAIKKEPVTIKEELLTIKNEPAEKSEEDTPVDNPVENPVEIKIEPEHAVDKQKKATIGGAPSSRYNDLLYDYLRKQDDKDLEDLLRRRRYADRNYSYRSKNERELDELRRLLRQKTLKSKSYKDYFIEDPWRPRYNRYNDIRSLNSAYSPTTATIFITIDMYLKKGSSLTNENIGQLTCTERRDAISRDYHILVDNLFGKEKKKSSSSSALERRYWRQDKTQTTTADKRLQELTRKLRDKERQQLLRSRARTYKKRYY